VLPECERFTGRRRDAGAGERGRPADLAEVRDPGLQADPEQQEDDTELGEDLQHLAGLDEAEHRGADDDAGQDLADDRRLPDPLEQLVPELGGQEHQEQVRERAGDRACGGERRVDHCARNRSATERKKSARVMTPTTRPSSPTGTIRTR
jgi:hypothetical protein